MAIDKMLFSHNLYITRFTSFVSNTQSLVQAHFTYANSLVREGILVILVRLSFERNREMLTV